MCGLVDNAGLNYGVSRSVSRSSTLSRVDRSCFHIAQLSRNFGLNHNVVSETSLVTSSLKPWAS
jgi:hypothetical protein